MLEFVTNLFGGKKETKTVSDIIFDLMFFIDTEAPKIMSSVKTEEDYVKRINNRVNNSFSISKMIIENNYYNYILGKEW